jgi:hypothetical protein
MRGPMNVRWIRKPERPDVVRGFSGAAAGASPGEAMDDPGGSPPEEDKIRAGARAWRAIREALARSPAGPPLREQLLRSWGARLRALGALAVSPPPRPAALAAAGPEAPAGEPTVVSVRSDDLRLTATLAITRFGEVWVGFETEDPELAGRAVRFELRVPEAPAPLAAGTVPLQPAGPGRFEGRRRLGTLEELGASGPFALRFAVVEED